MPEWIFVASIALMIAWLFFAIVGFSMILSDFKRDSSYDNAVGLRWATLALICTPLAPILAPIIIVCFIGFGLWEVIIKNIWKAFWMKKPERNRNDFVDSHN